VRELIDNEIDMVAGGSKFELMFKTYEVCVRECIRVGDREICWELCGTVEVPD
jgi:hypothetical protein